MVDLTWNDLLNKFEYFEIVNCDVITLLVSVYVPTKVKEILPTVLDFMATVVKLANFLRSLLNCVIATGYFGHGAV